MSSSLVVAGVDVGGIRKGFHAVALAEGALLGHFASCDPAKIADWCRSVGARFVGVDAPCRWSLTGRARPAELALMRGGIQCFSTPSQLKGQCNAKGFYGWMINGMSLYGHLESNHVLYDGACKPVTGPTCFETFPQAVACALAGRVVSAKQKRTVRRALLIEAGIDTRSLTNIDMVDAALCAVTAYRFALGRFRCYGDPETGLIVVPA